MTFTTVDEMKKDLIRIFIYFLQRTLKEGEQQESFNILPWDLVQS